MNINNAQIEKIKFRFKPKYQTETELELPFAEHIEELRQRSFHILILISLLTLIAFLNIKEIVTFLEQPVTNVKFFQLSPGEYFLATVRIAFYSGLLATSPIIVNQVILFIVPGLTSSEKKLLLPLLLGSTLLFFLSLGFSYYSLIPAALNFFLSYSSGTIEPLWSFNQYFDFILVLFYTTGLAFQIPIVQVILGILKITSSQEMIKLWRYVLLFATIIGAILTPSTDPITQLLLSSAIILLYCLGIIIVIAIEK